MPMPLGVARLLRRLVGVISLQSFIQINGRKVDLYCVLVQLRSEGRAALRVARLKASAA